MVERCRGQWPSQSLLLLIIKNLGLHFPLLMNVFWSWVIHVSVIKPKRLQIKTFFSKLLLLPWNGMPTHTYFMRFYSIIIIIIIIIRELGKCEGCRQGQ